jgi:hypothetical protein
MRCSLLCPLAYLRSANVTHAPSARGAHLANSARLLSTAPLCIERNVLTHLRDSFVCKRTHAHTHTHTRTHTHTHTRDPRYGVSVDSRWVGSWCQTPEQGGSKLSDPLSPPGMVPQSGSEQWTALHFNCWSPRRWEAEQVGLIRAYYLSLANTSTVDVCDQRVFSTGGKSRTGGAH